MHWGLLTALHLGAAVVAPPEHRPQAELDTCSLDGQGNVERCERIYWRTRLIGAALPSYTYATDGRRGFHGMVWNLSVDIPRDFWAAYFSLGPTAAPPPSTPNVFRINVGASFAWFPRSGELVGRLVFRVRVISLAWPNSPAASFVHLSLGLGGYLNQDGPGPRLELRARLGHLAWGGLVLVAGYQGNILRNRHVGDFSLGFEAPWMWWW